MFFSNSSIRSVVLAASLFASVSGSLAAFETVESKSLVRSGDRVTFVGAGFIERMQQNDWLEAMMTVALPDTKFRNIGWSGDTVFGDARAVFGSRDDGFARLLRDIEQAQPTLAIVCYGENECWDGEASVEPFIANYKKLLLQFQSNKTRVIVLLPRLRETVASIPEAPVERYNANLRIYNEATRKLCKSMEVPFVDLEGFAANESLTSDGIYWTEQGYYRVAVEICRQLEIPHARIKMNMNWPNQSISMDGTSGQINLKLSNNEAKVDLKLASLPVASKGDVDVIEINASQPNAKLQTVHVDELAKQIDELRGRINQKNSWFFHRYRPQNETYLFLFRKHEQGNNAAELTEIEPKIKDFESDIARSSQAKPFSLVLPKSGK